jgi:transposase
MDSQPDDIETLKAELAVARAKAADDAEMIAQQKLEIAKLRRQIYGPRSERTARLLDQMELELAEQEAAATEDEIAAERAAAKTTTVAAFTRKRPARQPFPAHLPRERVVVPGPTACTCCGGTRLRKLGESVTETLEVVPRQWKVISHVREKMTCRDCEKISEPPAPFHVTPRGWAGPHLLAMLLFEKFGQHQPLNRQAERYAREGVPLSLSTLADQVGAGCAVLEPLLRRIERHVLGAERLHGDDTTVPVLAKGKTDIGPTFAMIAPLQGEHRRRRCTTTRATEAASILEGISPIGRDCSRPMPTAVTVSFMLPSAGQGQSWKRPAGPMRAGRSSRSPISKPVPVARPKARRRHRSRPWRWRPSVASMPCSRSSGRSMAGALRSVARCARI